MITADKCPTCGRRFSTPRAPGDGNGIKVSASDAAEARKQVKDRARAESAIAALGRVLANPTSLLARAHIGDQLGIGFLESVSLERTRLLLALADPEALRAIYRRNEKARPAAVQP